MKVRQGFVSNSSSSSFCAYGVVVDTLNMLYSPAVRTKISEDEDIDAQKAFALYTEGLYGRALNTQETNFLADVDREIGLVIRSDLYELGGLDITNNYDAVYIGRHPADFQDDWTVARNKKEVQDIVLDIFKEMPEPKKRSLIFDYICEEIEE